MNLEPPDPLERFFKQVESRPDNPAVIGRHPIVSYGQLGKRTRQIAAAIAGHGDAPRVLINLPQGADAYASMLATLMAGGMYCPINVDGPRERQAAIVTQFCPDVVITDSTEQLDQLNGGFTGNIIVTDALGPAMLENPRPRSDLAYTIFTSGSTGVPKGVMIPRQGLAHYVEWAIAALGMGPGDRCSQHPNIGFDLSVLDIYASLCSGAALVPLGRSDDRLFPAKAVRHFAITVWISVPSIVDLMVKADQVTDEHLGTLRLLFFCGEPLFPRHLDSIFSALPDATVINAYGPTEATVSCTQISLSADTYKSACFETVSLGTAIPGMDLTLVGGNEADEGEIVLSGAQLARGYWDSGELTKKAFRGIEGRDAIGYFTGDWGKIHEGHLYFQCRIDRQVKIHGHRLELAEVDAALNKVGYPVTFTIYEKGRLVSFIESAEECDPAAVRASLADWLPPHAVPREILVLSVFPRNPNDKIDSTKLRNLIAGGTDGN